MQMAKGNAKKSNKNANELFFYFLHFALFFLKVLLNLIWAVAKWKRKLGKNTKCCKPDIL